MAKRDRKVPKDDRAETDPTIEKKKKFGAKNPKDEDEREDDSDEEESDKEDADERDDDDAEPAKKSDKKVRPDKVDPKGGFRDSDKEEHGGDLSTDKKKSIKGKQIEINPELSAVVERIENIPEGLWETAVVDEAERLADTIRSSLKRKSDDHGVPYETILEVFRRGWEARRTATLSEQENAFNRVNSFLAGGLASRLDSDLLTEEGGAGEIGTDELVSTYASDTPGQRFIKNVREKKARKAAGWTLESMVGSRDKAKSEETAKNSLDRAVESHRRLYGESVELMDEARRPRWSNMYHSDFKNHAKAAGHTVTRHRISGGGNMYVAKDANGTVQGQFDDFTQSGFYHGRDGRNKNLPKEKPIFDSFSPVDEKHIGFEKLENELSHKGVKSPGALAAYIGRKKYGKKKFDKAAEEGKKLHEDDEHINELSGKGFINKAIAADDHSNKARTDRLLDLRTIRNNKDKTDRSSKRKVANAREWYRKDTARDRGMNIAAESVEQINEISKEDIDTLAKSKTLHPFSGGRKTSGLTKNHVPIVWENMLGTVHARSPEGHIKYHDFDWHGAHKHARTHEYEDLRICRTPRDKNFNYATKRGVDHSSTGPRVGKVALWGVHKPPVNEDVEQVVDESRVNPINTVYTISDKTSEHYGKKCYRLGYESSHKNAESAVKLLHNNEKMLVKNQHLKKLHESGLINTNKKEEN